MAANPASMFPSTTRISTNVPRSGRERLTPCEHGFMQGEQAPHAFGDMAAGEGGAADIADILLELHWIGGSLADELAAPAGVAHLAAVIFPVLQDFDAAHAAVDADPQGIGNELVLADDLVDEEPAAARNP